MLIAGLWIYPIKSVGGVRVRRARITAGGSLAGDREWLVVDEAGAMLWQGMVPRMATLSADLVPGGLGVSNRDGQRIEVGVRAPGHERTVTQYGFSFPGVDAGDEAAAALSDWLERPVRLVRIGEAAHAWADLYPMHVVGEASLAALNERMVREGRHEMEIERFRPNVVLGAAEAFEEERTEVIDFRSASLHFVEPSKRCVLPSIDRRTGEVERGLLRPIATMSRERTTAARSSFGVYSRAEGDFLERGMQSA